MVLTDVLVEKSIWGDTSSLFFAKEQYVFL